MKTKHTPGPWDYIGDHIVGVVGNCECPVKQSFAEHFAYPEFAHESHDVVKPITEDELPEGVTIEEHMANCRLIAAAPDLLAACEAAQAAHVHWAECDECDTNEPFRLGCPVLYELAENATKLRCAAIAKANGDALQQRVRAVIDKTLD